MRPAVKQINSGQTAQKASFAGRSVCPLFDNTQFKQCSKCKQSKKLSEFNGDSARKDGYRSWCKSCTRLIDKQYSQTERHKKIRKLYRQTKKYKKINSQHQIRYRKRYPQKIAAHNALNRYIPLGKIQKPDKYRCFCGEHAKEYHHYLGYSPEHFFDVIPVCRLCHAKIHRNQNNRQRGGRIKSIPLPVRGLPALLFARKSR